ncbi:hypothetical protein PAE9249_03964 [Paenibacillus sp. CECT 9249]|nr:hypothetical protein PAE9249_03964 [Paenibacillus sp. CECT 9249]
MFDAIELMVIVGVDWIFSLVVEGTSQINVLDPPSEYSYEQVT